MALRRPMVAHVVTLLLFQALLLQSISFGGTPPAWWTTRSVLNDQAPSDYSVANVGQLKTIASKAALEVAAKRGSVSPQIASLLQSWESGGTDYRAVTVGEVKSVAALFYSQLGIAVPWTTSDTSDDADYRAANVGQLKTAFAFPIAAGGPPPQVMITTTFLPAAVQGTSYSAVLAARGGRKPYLFSLISGSLPPGVVLNASTGTVSGVPSALGTYTMGLRVTDSLGTTAERSLALVVTNSTGSTNPTPVPTVPDETTQFIPASVFNPARQLWLSLNPPPAGSSETDFNGNGISNRDEYRMFQANPQKWPLNSILISSTDWDGDGLTNTIEAAYGLNPRLFADALADADQDGLLNFDEIINLADSHGASMSRDFSIRDSHQPATSEDQPEPEFVIPANCPLKDGAIMQWLRSINASTFDLGDKALGRHPGPAAAGDPVRDWVDADENDLPDGYEVWLASNGGSLPGLNSRDWDSDGMPNLWEHRYRLSFWDNSNGGGGGQSGLGVLRAPAVIDPAIYEGRPADLAWDTWMRQNVTLPRYEMQDPDHDQRPNIGEFLLSRNPWLPGDDEAWFSGQADDWLARQMLPRASLIVTRSPASVYPNRAGGLYELEVSVRDPQRIHPFTMAPVTFSVAAGSDGGITGGADDVYGLHPALTRYTNYEGKARVWVVAPSSFGPYTVTISCPLIDQPVTLQLQVTADPVLVGGGDPGLIVGADPPSRTPGSPEAQEKMSFVVGRLVSRTAWAGLQQEYSDGGGSPAPPAFPMPFDTGNRYEETEEAGQNAIESLTKQLDNAKSDGPEEVNVTLTYDHVDEAGSTVTRTEQGRKDVLLANIPVGAFNFNFDHAPWRWRVTGMTKPGEAPPSVGGQVPDGHTYREKTRERPEFAKLILTKKQIDEATADGSLTLVDKVGTPPATNTVPVVEEWQKLKKCQTKADGKWETAADHKYPTAQGIEIRMLRSHLFGGKLTPEDHKKEITRSFVILREAHDSSTGVTTQTVRAATLKLKPGEMVSTSGSGNDGASGFIFLYASATQDKNGWMKERLLPVELAPEVVAVNTNFDEGDTTESHAAKPDCANETLKAKKDHLDGKWQEGDIVTDDLHKGFFGLRPGTLPYTETAGAVVKIKKLDKNDPETNRKQSGHVRLYAVWGSQDSESEMKIELYNKDSLVANDIGPQLYHQNPNTPVTFYLEGVEPGKITLEFSYQKGSTSFKHEQEFLVATKKTRAQWREEVVYHIRLQQSSFSPPNPYSDITKINTASGYRHPNPANDNSRLIALMYYYYAQLFDENQEKFLWPGMARVAASSIYAGMSDIHLWNNTFLTSGIAGNFTWTGGDPGSHQMLKEFMIPGAQAIFHDLAWAHRAYAASGIYAIKHLDETENGSVDFRAWEILNEGISGNNMSKIRDAGGRLLNREQNIVIQHYYASIGTVRFVQPGFHYFWVGPWMGGVYVPPGPDGKVEIGEWLSANAINNPMIGGPAFRDVVPGGRIDNKDDRWQWISDPARGMLPIWTGTATTGTSYSAADRRNLAAQLLKESALPYTSILTVGAGLPPW